MHYCSAGSLLLLITATCSYFLVTHAGPPHRPELTVGNVSASCIPRERDALLAFKQGITNDTYNMPSSRGNPGKIAASGKESPAGFSSRSGHVVMLDLSGGLFAPALVGQINPSLLSLVYLEYLDLSNNFLEGPNHTVPEFLGSMKNLRHAALSWIPLSGTVPTLFSNLTKLEYLDISKTSFFGRVPPQLGNLSNLRHLDVGSMDNACSTDISWLTRLQFLEHIGMGFTNLSTIVDCWPLVVNKIPTLEHIILNSCSLPSANQSLPHLNLTKLEELDLMWNYFGHSIASSWFWKVKTMKSLSLIATYLDGPFPVALGEMLSLKQLEFSNNGNAAVMTVNLKNLCELESLSLDQSLSSGNITEFVDKLPKCSSPKLSTLSLKSNNMTGMLPNFMPHLNNLIILNLSNNSIGGDIPRGIRNFSNLKVLYLNSNQLSGKIPLLPRSIRSLDLSMNLLSGHYPLIEAPNLMFLLLSNNYITGQLPGSICEFENLFSLDLSSNAFEGELPSCSRMPYLRFLLLSNNSSSGKFPSWLGCFSSLVLLDLSRNKFYGTIPASIGDLVNLQFLLLSHNMFSGGIPVNITNLRQLQYLNLAANNISGTIHLPFNNLVKMTQNRPVEPPFDLLSDDSLDISTLVMKHVELKYHARGISYLVGVDLSLSNLTGDIPDEITSLHGLLNLNLSWNQFSGDIPKKIGAMKYVESLDLSRNNIFGEIPPSLSDLSYVSYMDLSYNNLTGQIPRGRQLDTLYMANPSIYDGNSGNLC